MKKKWSDDEKARIAILALKEEKTISELAQETGAHPNMISKWKRELIQNADGAFRNGKSRKEQELEREKEELLKQVGTLYAANDFLKKNLKKLGL